MSMQTQNIGKAKQLVTFLISGREYAIDLEHVQEIIPMIAIDEMEEMPPYVLGIINLRGTTIPVVDIVQKMGASETPINIYTPIIICRTDDHFVGIVAEKMREILSAENFEIERLADPAKGEHVIEGVVNMGDRSIFLIDFKDLELDKLFAR